MVPLVDNALICMQNTYSHTVKSLYLSSKCWNRVWNRSNRNSSRTMKSAACMCRLQHRFVTGFLHSSQSQSIRMTISLGLCVYTYTCAKDDVWICGRIYSDMNGGCGKLNEHNIHLQGSYLCSNSNCIQLDLLLPNFSPHIKQCCF